MSTVASTRIANAPPRLAMMRSTSASFRARLNWIAEVSSTAAAMTTGSQMRGEQGAKTATATAPTAAATHTGTTLRNEMATPHSLSGPYTDPYEKTCAPAKTSVAQLLILSSAADTDALPALELLSHRVRVIPAEPASLVNAPTADAVIVDARHDLASAKGLCKSLRTTGLDVPLVLVLTEGGLPAVSAEWGVDEVILTTAGPAEVDARIRLVIDRLAQRGTDPKFQASGVTIDEASYSAKVHGRPLDLTYKEFELLRFLATHPSRVFTREQLLSEV